MTGFGKLIRTTAFRLVVTYLLVFVLFAAALLGYVAWNTRSVIQNQLSETIETEIQSLAEQYRLGGPRRLAVAIERRSRGAKGFIYFLTDAQGDAVAGNAAEVQPMMSREPGWYEFRFDRTEDQQTERVHARVRLFQLPNGLKLVVGHDLADRQRMRLVIRNAMGMSVLLVIILGGVGAWVVSRRVLRPVDDLTAAASRIMAGNLTERLPVRGVNDEFDRLAEHLNRMLNRIGELMTGLREVSDNIAHDLRTPLTRLRAASDEALRTAKSPEELKLALERTIDESDGLIRIFNALLMIARAEAGSAPGTLSDLPLNDIVADVVELYEPVAEDAGVDLVLGDNPATLVRGNRELLSQAAANLVDNAIKHGHPADAAHRGRITVAMQRLGETVALTVADNGSGVPDADKTRVTERFVRLEKSRAQPGSGLGLSLVAAIARLHGGEMSLQDNGPGLRVVLTLPVRQAAAGG